MVSGGANYEYRFGPNNDWSIVVANTRTLREKTFRFVYDTYVSKGYNLQLGHKSGLWCTIHHLHPSTISFLAEKNGQPVGTVSIVPDSRLGLPADLIFPEKLSFLRKADRRLCEAFSLAAATGITDGSVEVTMHLYKCIHLAAIRLLHTNEIVASIMAHHANFYTDILLFDEVSPDSKQSPKTDEQVRFTHINLETMSEQYAQRYSQLKGKRNLYRWFFQNKEESAIVEWIRQQKRPMTADDLNYFGVLKSDILAETKPETVTILMEYYRQTEDVVLD
ncbi:MAG: hypothetical protein ABFD82_14500 [Syntrophaceae bacterium]